MNKSERNDSNLLIYSEKGLKICKQIKSSLLLPSLQSPDTSIFKSDHDDKKSQQLSGISIRARILEPGVLNQQEQLRKLMIEDLDDKDRFNKYLLNRVNKMANKAIMFQRKRTVSDGDTQQQLYSYFNKLPQKVNLTSVSNTETIEEESVTLFDHNHLLASVQRQDKLFQQKQNRVNSLESSSRVEQLHQNRSRQYSLRNNDHSRQEIFQIEKSLPIFENKKKDSPTITTSQIQKLRAHSNNNNNNNNNPQNLQDQINAYYNNGLEQSKDHYQDIVCQTEHQRRNTNSMQSNNVLTSPSRLSPLPQVNYSFQGSTSPSSQFQRIEDLIFQKQFSQLVNAESEIERMISRKKHFENEFVKIKKNLQNKVYQHSDKLEGSQAQPKTMTTEIDPVTFEVLLRETNYQNRLKNRLRERQQEKYGRHWKSLHIPSQPMTSRILPKIKE